MEPRSDGFVRRALREPTLHFALLAALLFGIGEAAKSWNRPVVEIDPKSIENRISQLERGRGSPLSDGERKLAAEAYIDEQVLAREARRRGLDDDERIRSILYQKMLHVLSGDVPQPADAELERFFEENRARYAGRPAVSVEDVLVEKSSVPDSGGRGKWLRRTVLSRVTAGELEWSFGEATAAMIFAAETGKWIGPHPSADGDHWFRVLERMEESEAPALADVRELVRFDWMAQKENALLRERIAELRKQYSIRFPEGESKP
jgi:hypothetical protein